jgi:SAM-dependent methyltransferase
MKQSLFTKNWLVHRLAEVYIRKAAGLARGRLLDVGCGTKPYLEAYSRFVSSYTGVDLLRARGNGSKADVYGDAQALPFKDGSFDTVVSFQVMEHVKEPWTMLENINRVLAPGGYLILTVPHMWGLHEIPNDYYRFTEYGLRYLYESAGLDVVKIEAMSGYWVTAGTRLCYYLEGLRTRILVPLFGLTFFVIQAASLFLDRFHRVETDTWNYIAIGRKKC